MQVLHKWQHPRNHRPHISTIQIPQNSPTIAWKTKSRRHNHPNRYKPNMHIHCENLGGNSPTSILQRRTTIHHDLQTNTETSQTHRHGHTYPRTRIVATNLQGLPQITRNKMKETNICKHNLTMKTYRLTTTSPLAA